jgi:hypothetical protein
MKRMASAKKKSSSKSQSVSGKRVSSHQSTTSRPRTTSKPPVLANQHFAICVCNDEYPASLELRKLYPVLPDAFADEHDMIRVVDESGEDYLFPRAYFVPVELPRIIERVLERIA